MVVNGLEQPGISVYGLRTRRPASEVPSFPSELWPGEVEVNTHRLVGEQWEVANWDVVLTQWPRRAAWRVAVRETLRSLVEAGCVVAWLGHAERFCDPPDLFDPQCMRAGVLASLTAAGQFICPVDPEEPLLTLSDGEMQTLRQTSGGLATSR